MCINEDIVPALKEASPGVLLSLEELYIWSTIVFCYKHVLFKKCKFLIHIAGVGGSGAQMGSRLSGYT
jgi:hypothetical protein